MRQWLLPAVALVLVVAGCSSPEGGGAGGEPRTIEVSMTDALRFDPDEMTVQAGETVAFQVTNTGELVHEFFIGDEAAQAEFEEEMASGGGMDHESDAGVSVEPGGTETFEYTFGEAGEALLAGCHEPGHYAGGMVASITVTP